MDDGILLEGRSCTVIPESASTERHSAMLAYAFLPSPEGLT